MRFRDFSSRRPRLTVRFALVGVLALLLAAAGTAALGAELAVGVDAPPGSAPTTISATTATASQPPAGPSADHPNPRVKLSYLTFSIGNVDATSVPLSAYQLDLYPLSMRFLRGGMSVLAGKGRAAMDSIPVTLRYGLLGVTGGFQFPARVTPFAEGVLMGGVLSGTLERAVTIPGTTASLDSASGVTAIYGRGLDLGAEFYTVGRLFVSASIGWLRTTWLGPDRVALNSGLASGLPVKALTTDSMTFKLGLGF